jgi:hypothetical protein
MRLEEQASQLAASEDTGPHLASALAPLPERWIMFSLSPRLLGPPHPPELPGPAWVARDNGESGLPEDLRVSAEWQKQLALRRYQHQVAEVRAAESMRQAELEAGLWREYQVALNNLKIREAIGGPGAAEAAESRQHILDVLQKKLAQAEAESEKRMAERVHELGALLETKLAQIEEEAHAEARRRGVAMLDDGRRDREELQERLGLEWWEPDWEEALGPHPDLFPQMAEQYEKTLKEQHRVARETMDTQARRMREAAGALRRLIRQEVETTARAQALAHGVLVSVPPLEPRRGRNITAQCAQWLRQQWPRL